MGVVIRSRIGGSAGVGPAQVRRAAGPRGGAGAGRSPGSRSGGAFTSAGRLLPPAPLCPRGCGCVILPPFLWHPPDGLDYNSHHASACPLGRLALASPLPVVFSLPFASCVELGRTRLLLFLGEPLKWGGALIFTFTTTLRGRLGGRENVTDPRRALVKWDWGWGGGLVPSMTLLWEGSVLFFSIPHFISRAFEFGILVNVSKEVITCFFFKTF